MPALTVAPQRPAAMGAVTVEGAVAAAEYFLALYPYVYNTGDLTEWKTLSHPECIFCASVISNVEAQHQASHHQIGGRITTSAGTGTEIDPGRWFSAELQVVQDPADEVDESGQPVGSPTVTQNVKAVFAIIQGDSGWSIREVQIIEPGEIS